jgi:hypothetical protein
LRTRSKTYSICSRRTFFEAIYLNDPKSIQSDDGAIRESMYSAGEEKKGGTMPYSRDLLTWEELGLCVGILMGITVLQSTGSVLALLALPFIGTVLGMVVARLSHSHPGWAEEE